MRTVTAESRAKYSKLFEDYVKKYGSFYDKDALEFIKSNFLDVNFEWEIDIDILNQVYEEIGVFNEYTNNSYTNFYSLISERYNLNQNILEVASGMFPSFARMVTRKQIIGTVTVMDPDTIIDRIDGIKIIKNELKDDFDASDYGFIYALSPCEALKTIIEVANKHNIEFCVLACGCTHLPKELIKYRSAIQQYYDYLEYICEIIENTIPKEMEYKIEYLKGFKTPVISTKKLKLN